MIAQISEGKESSIHNFRQADLKPSRTQLMGSPSRVKTRIPRRPLGIAFSIATSSAVTQAVTLRAGELDQRLGEILRAEAECWRLGSVWRLGNIDLGGPMAKHRKFTV